MRFKLFTTQLALTAIPALLAASASMAADDVRQAPTLQHHNPPPQADFVRQVRDATRRYRDINAALSAGYVEQFGCVSGSDEGAMGVHLVNFALVGNPELKVKEPELLVYEPGPNGKMDLVAADYLVMKKDWEIANPTLPGQLPPVPELLGQLFHLFEAPNRFGLEAFYTLHVWAWKENPHGTFVNWHPQVSCDQFEDDAPAR
jgi:hypothetical protein